MKVELFLKNINQEMIDAGRNVRRRGEASWVVSWPDSCCVLDFSLVHRLERIGYPVTHGFMLRAEKEGGMFWDARTGAVYRADEEAYHAMLELDRGYSELHVARRMNVSMRKVASLTRQLKRIKQRPTKKRQIKKRTCQNR